MRTLANERSFPTRRWRIPGRLCTRKALSSRLRTKSSFRRSLVKPAQAKSWKNGFISQFSTENQNSFFPLLCTCRFSDRLLPIFNAFSFLSLWPLHVHKPSWNAPSAIGATIRPHAIRRRKRRVLSCSSSAPTIVVARSTRKSRVVNSVYPFRIRR